mmetsp:Transcript_14672/g.33937  ORF Transcript_14672/g.33937 Transcript_14672/m.33937 type:complete len:97 (+) Transcript_14672:440-730(+)
MLLSQSACRVSILNGVHNKPSHGTRRSIVDFDFFHLGFETTRTETLLVDNQLLHTKKTVPPQRLWTTTNKAIAVSVTQTYCARSIGESQLSYPALF